MTTPNHNSKHTVSFTIIKPIIGFNGEPLNTVFENRILPESVHTNCQWTQFISELTSSMPIMDDKHTRQMIIPVTWKKDFENPATNAKGELKTDSNGNTFPRRAANNIDQWFMLPVDIDEQLTIEKAKEEFKDFEYVGYTTFNHSNDKHKFRLLIPLAEPITHEEFQKRLPALKEFIGVADNASVSSSQGFFLPSCHEENKEIALTWHNKGKFLDLFEFKASELPKVRPTKVKNAITGKYEDKHITDFKIDLSKHPEGLKYLKDFIQENMAWIARSPECFKMHSLLKNFNVPEADHFEIVRSFMSFQSSHEDDIERCYMTAESTYDGLGILRHFLKFFEIDEPFDFEKFKYLTGQFCLDTVRERLQVNEAKVTEYHLLGKDVFETEEDGLVYGHQSAEKIGQIFDDNTFPFGVSILSSPTNSGKTHMFVHGLTSKRIMILPTKALVDQVCKDYKSVKKCHSKMDFPLGADVIAMTYDKMKVLKELIRKGDVKQQEYDLFVDEAHNLYTSYSYRADAMNMAYDAIRGLSFRKVVLMSGTIRPDFLPDLRVEKKIIVKRAKPQAQKCEVIYTSVWPDVVKEKANKGELTLILLNDKAKGDYLAQYLTGSESSVPEIKDRVIKRALKDANNRSKLRCQVFNADNQSTFGNQQMLFDEAVKSGVDVLIFTQIGVEGLNLKNTNIKNVIAIGNHNTVTLEQLVNRARLTKPDLYVVRHDSEFGEADIQTINLKGEMNDAGLFMKFANARLESTDSDYSSVKRYLEQSLNQLPSTISKTVRFDHTKRQFVFSALGLASVIFDTDGKNEGLNPTLFDLHMSNYNFEVTHTLVMTDPERMFGFDAAVEKIKEERALAKFDALRYVEDEVDTAEEFNTHVTQFENEELPSSELRTSLETAPDVFYSIRFLNRFYDYRDSIEIAKTSLNRSDFVEVAIGYALDMINGSWVRNQLEREFPVGTNHTFPEVQEKMKRINDFAMGDIHANTNLMLSAKGANVELRRHFDVSISSKRENGQPNKTRRYEIISHNPVGCGLKEIEPSVSYSDNTLELFKRDIKKLTSKSINEDLNRMRFQENLLKL